jgi:mono/diheme cytochrome c family protein
MTRPMVSFAVAAALLVATTHMQAQEIGQPQKGRALAQQLCADCHAVQKGSTVSPIGNAPPFGTIAAVPGMTATALHAALLTSHRTMPNVTLETNDLDDMAAYILSLKPGG